MSLAPIFSWSSTHYPSLIESSPLLTSLACRIVTIQPGFIDTRMTQKMREHGSTVDLSELARTEMMTRRVKSTVKEGDVKLVSWSFTLRHSFTTYAFKGLNPICDDWERYVAMKMGVEGD